MKTLIQARMACLCLSVLAGCSRMDQNADTIPMPSSVFVDVAASAEWKASHDVFASCKGQRLKLPAWISFRRTPNPITYGGYALGGETYVEFGGMRITITTAPDCPMTFADERRPTASAPAGDGRRALAKAGIKYWAVTPADAAGQDPQWVYPAPEQLEALAAAGKVQTIQLDFP